MPTSQQHVDDATPLGATLTGAGATFRVWAPAAHAVHVVTDGLHAARAEGPTWTPAEQDLLVRRGDGTWAGFVPGVRAGDAYRFWVAGDGGSGFKRDPYARELGTFPAFPDCDCIVHDPARYPWHDGGWSPPAARDLVVYQLHLGVHHAVDAHGRDVRAERGGTFLDLLWRLEHLRALGVNALLPLPVQEFPSEFSMGYNGTDYFSPEMDYQVRDEAELARHLAKANALLAGFGHAPLAADDVRAGRDQLALLIDLCHLHGIAVLLDVVYNHAGGGFDDQSLYFFDRRPFASNADSLYFADRGWAGGLVFDYAKPQVRRFLVDNALAFVRELHADGFRYDEVSVIDDHGGWSFCQELSSAVRAAAPRALQVAEYWKERRELAVTPAPHGMGFDAALADPLRDALRAALGQAAGGRDARVGLDAVARALERPHGYPDAWRALQCVENHDLVYADRPPSERLPRIPRLADAADARSWYARSRARVATALLLTAPGIPLLFMGQELLEDKPWSDNPRFSQGTLVWWDGLASDRAMADHLALTRDLLALRRERRALRGEGLRVVHVHEGNRVLAFQRWVEGAGEDLLVVASLAEETCWSYELGFPHPGPWRELFNSDFYDGLPNPAVAGNGGEVRADGPPLHGCGWSAALVLPANAVLVLARA